MLMHEKDHSSRVIRLEFSYITFLSLQGPGPGLDSYKKRMKLFNYHKITSKKVKFQKF